MLRWSIIFLVTANCFGQGWSHYERSDKKERVVVFVHGILGHPKGTWTASNGAYWPKLLVSDPVFSDSDVYVAAYNTPLSATEKTVPELVQNIDQDLKHSRVFENHREVVFVAHSLGGLMVDQLIVAHPEYAKKVRFIYFFGTPHAGSFVANFAAVLFGKDALLKGMFRGDGNNFLIALDHDWRGARFDVKRICAYEENKVAPPLWWTKYAPGWLLKQASGMLVVDRISATQGCDGISTSVARDHFEIVKPLSVADPMYVLLSNAQRDNPILPPPLPPEVPILFEKTICTFYGASNQGGQAWQKDEACRITNFEKLDSSFRQNNFNCCGGGASAPMSNGDIPPGIEIKVSGGHYWAVFDGKLNGTLYRLHTYCGPEPAPGPGCNVSVSVVGHYLVLPSAIPR